MVSCAVSECEVTQRNNPNKYTFHRFPKNPLLRSKWLRIINKTVWTPTAGSSICSKHFESKYFIQRKFRRLLLKDSIPTLFVPVLLKKRKPSSYVYRDISPPPVQPLLGPSNELLSPRGIQLINKCTKLKEKISKKNKLIRNLKTKTQRMRTRLMDLQTTVKALKYGQRLRDHHNNTQFTFVSTMESGAIKEEIHTEPMLNDPRYITLLSIIVLFFTLVFWWCFSRGRTLRKSVLLMGLSDSGKTLLFVRLVYSQYRQTFTSMKENIEDYVTSNKALKIVDLPGQERLRGKYFDQYKNNAKAIVYVVDSVTIQKEIRDVAEHLYTILSDSVVYKNSLPILILCNKQDQPLAKGCQVIRSLLEKEMNFVRVTKSNQLQSVDPSQGNTIIYLGKSGKDFEFSHINNRLEFEECSANTSDDDNPDDISALQNWISKL